MDAKSQTSTQSSVGHESADISVRPLVAWTILLALVCVLSVWITRRMFFSFEATATRLDTPVHPLAEPQETRPAPLLQQTPARDLREYQRTIRDQLDTYGWIDRPQGVVHIPIERAIELTAERGLPSSEKR
jgi:hypothetical protein